MASASVWIAIAHLLALFNISYLADADGKPIEEVPIFEYETNVMLVFLVVEYLHMWLTVHLGKRDLTNAVSNLGRRLLWYFCKMHW